MTSVLAVDLGGTSMRVGRTTPDGEVLERREEKTGDDTGRLIELMREVATGGPVAHAVVGVPGRVDYGHGRLEYAPNLPEVWVDVMDEGKLSAELGLPVALANDADLAAVGEWWFGAGKDFADMAYMTVSTGIGAGVVVGGLLLHGRRSMAEVGHTVVDGQALAEGRPATVEELGSGTALDRLAKEAGLDVTGKDLVDLVRTGDDAAAKVLTRVVTAAAIGAVNLAHLFTPEVIVVGGGLGLNGDLVLDPIRALLASRGPRGLPEPIVVVNAALGDDAGLAGAGAWHRAFRPEAASR
ncbi:MAG: glucokinase [Actinomycetia bacterium]|nr:glucokinase [Actinomycetes bacterium]